MSVLEPVRLVPWKTFKFAVGLVRTEYFAVPWPDHVSHDLLDPDEVDEARNAFYRNGFEEVLYSAYYSGEVVNVRRPIDNDRELHVRINEAGAMNAHREPNRYTRKTAHVNEDGLEWLGRDDLEALLASVST